MLKFKVELHRQKKLGGISMRYLKWFIPILVVVLVGCTHSKVVPAAKSGPAQLQMTKVKSSRVKHQDELYLHGSIVSNGVIMQTKSITTTWIDSHPVIVVKLENGIIQLDKIAEANPGVLKTYSLCQGDLLRYKVVHKEHATDKYVLVANKDMKKN